jgi:UDP-N-acetylglucosamine--N-acetylmuramyl-(pentapeptide) pyrophosphoryl-undecaprenol N-acetylglucosamine transferase
VTSSDQPKEPSQSRRIAIVAGGTAGHVYPALALGQAYQRSFDQVDLLYIGTAQGWESKLVPQAGHRFEEVSASPLFGVGAVAKVAAFWRVLLATVQARRILKANQTKLVIGFGGYASAGAILAGRSLGLGTAVHEANIIPGLTNRYLGRIVDRVYLGFEVSRSVFAKQKTLVSGNPVRPEVALACRKHARASMRKDQRSVHVLVTGGSAGSPFLNSHVPELMAKIGRYGPKVEVWHQAGRFDIEPVRRRYQNLGVPVTLSSFIDDMAEAYAWADFVVACSGSGTLAELAAVGLPALLVPMGQVASDHQAANAAAFVASSGGIWVREEEWRADELAGRIARLLCDPDALRKESEGSQRLAKPDAAQAIIADCETMMTGRW